MPAERKALRNLAISDSGLVFDPATGAIATSNSTGVRILRELCEGKSAAQIREALFGEYDTDREVLERDIRDFLAQLQGQGYLHE
ncbi:MAG: PqqD family protein [Oligoflexia bacterium]|nr:PqqD family protein [Oligoflexia bacterium]